MIITAADLNESHIGAQITLTSYRGNVYTGEFVSVMADTLIDDTRLRVELITNAAYRGIFVEPNTSVTIEPA